MSFSGQRHQSDLSNYILLFSLSSSTPTCDCEEECCRYIKKKTSHVYIQANVHWRMLHNALISDDWAYLPLVVNSCEWHPQMQLVCKYESSEWSLVTNASSWTLFSIYTYMHMSKNIPCQASKHNVPQSCDIRFVRAWLP